jgi:hypothetical protein
VAGAIVAMGGGPLLHAEASLEEELLRLAPSKRPVVCFLATATGDDAGALVAFYEAFTPRECRPTHVELFGMPEDPARRVAAAAQRDGASVWRVGPDGSEPVRTRRL